MGRYTLSCIPSLCQLLAAVELNSLVGESGAEVVLDVEIKNGPEVLVLSIGDQADQKDEAFEDQIVVDFAVTVLVEDCEQSVQNVLEELDDLFAVDFHQRHQIPSMKAHHIMRNSPELTEAPKPNRCRHRKNTTDVQRVASPKWIAQSTCTNSTEVFMLNRKLGKFVYFRNTISLNGLEEQWLLMVDRIAYFSFSSSE